MEQKRCRYESDIYWQLVEAGWSLGAKVTDTNGEVWVTMVKL